MKELLEYRDNSYFNDTDYFLFDNRYGKLGVTQLDCSGARWYPKAHKEFVGGMLFPSGIWLSMPWFKSGGYVQCYMDTVPSLNCNDLLGREVRHAGTNIKGTITKFLLGNIGVNWYRGQGEEKKKHGMPYFWNDPNDLELT